MPIDLYKLSGLDYRDKTREAKLAVDSDVERARRVGEIQRAAEIEHAQKLEGIARQRFLDNYSKTIDPNSMPEGLNDDAKNAWAKQDAEAAWAKKVSSGDLGDVLSFEKVAGALPGARELSRSKVATEQETAEADRAEQKAKKLEGIAKVAGLIMPGVGEFIAKGVAKKAEKDAKKQAADVTAAETEGMVNEARKADAVEFDTRMRTAEVAGAELSNRARQNAVDQGRFELFAFPDTQALKIQQLEEQIKGMRRENAIDPAVLEEMQRARIEQTKALAEAARARAASGSRNLGIGTAGQPLSTGKKTLTADELDLNAILR